MMAHEWITHQHTWYVDWTHVDISENILNAEIIHTAHIWFFQVGVL
jgi:hypothetical protein